MTEQMQTLKNRLLELGYTDNEYLTKYLDMIQANLTTIRVRKSTQAHHAIPATDYWLSTETYNRREATKLANADPANILVNLKYTDHLIIHAYLTLCTDMNKVQYKYESQADLRKYNSKVGATACNRAKAKQSKVNNTVVLKHPTSKEEHDYLFEVYSLEEAEEILKL